MRSGKSKFLCIAVCLVLCLCMTGCHLTVHGILDDVLSHTMDRAEQEEGKATVDTTQVIVSGDVTALEIVWVSGTITVRNAPVESITVTETANATLRDSQRFFVKERGGVLAIAYSTASGLKANNVKKDLEVLVPEGMGFESLMLETVGSKAVLEIPAEAVSINAVSGNCDLTVQGCHGLEIDTVSADVTAELKTVPGYVHADTVSGDITLYLPEDASFRAETSFVSGSFHTEIPVTREEKQYVAGNGDAQFRFSGVSGSVNIAMLP